MPVIFLQEMVQALGDIRRDIGLIALLTYIGRDIPDNEQLLPTPDFQRGLARLQCASAQITPINHIFYFLIFRVL